MRFANATQNPDLNSWLALPAEVPLNGCWHLLPSILLV